MEIRGNGGDKKRRKAKGERKGEKTIWEILSKKRNPNCPSCSLNKHHFRQSFFFFHLNNIQVYRDYHLTKDKQFLMDMWPGVKVYTLLLLFYLLFFCFSNFFCWFRIFPENGQISELDVKTNRAVKIENFHSFYVLFCNCK